ncbi:hypothetical protein FACS1894188_12200 [Clostridia bacterium]|nr:hypothetical protein FACS1894188_12200 [Clostridia bacterium]
MANYPKKDNKIGNIAAIIILIIAIVIYVRIDTPAQRSTVFKKTDVVFELQPDDRASAYSYGGKGFFIGTRGGMNFYNDNSNSPLWTAAYTPVMRTPVTDARGTYIGVCDALGSVFYMFSADGQMYALSYDNPVLSFSVNSSGYAAVISRDQNGYKVQALNPQGKEINCYYNQKPNVFPVSADVSANGSILSVALTDINEKHLSSKLY